MRSPLLVEDECIEAVAMFDIGASGAHTKTTNIPGKLFASVARTAAGSYTVTFARGVPTGPFLGITGTVFRTAAAAPLIVRPTLSGYTAETAAAAATVTLESWDAATPTKTEMSSGDKVLYVARWLKTR